MKLVVSGFEPFGGMAVNASAEVVGELQRRGVDSLVLPVEFGRAFDSLARRMSETGADAVLALGLAAERWSITVERVAINWMESAVADNAGVRAEGMRIVEGAADGLFAALPVAGMVEAICAAGLDCSVSNSAGTYVCNELLFRLLLDGRERGYRAGFIHLPPLPGTVEGNPGLALADQVRAVEAAIGAVRRDRDIAPYHG